MKLAFLQWLPDNARFAFTKWVEIGAEVGVEFGYARIRTSYFAGSEMERGKFVDKALQLVEEADAFVVPDGTNYEDLARVHERVAQGTRLLYFYRFSGEESFRRSEAFLAHYDMAPTRKTILRGVDPDANQITLKRESGSLLDPRLFRGVSEVIHRPSLPTLVQR